MPSNLSIFSTIPKRMIHLVDGETGIMACSIQRKTDSHAPEIRTSLGQRILQNSFLFNANYDFIHELNLKINTSKLDRFDTLDFVCAVEINDVETLHPTRFTWHRKYCYTLLSFKHVTCLHASTVSIGILANMQAISIMYQCCIQRLSPLFNCRNLSSTTESWLLIIRVNFCLH